MTLYRSVEADDDDHPATPFDPALLHVLATSWGSSIERMTGDELAVRQVEATLARLLDHGTISERDLLTAIEDIGERCAAGGDITTARALSRHLQRSLYEWLLVIESHHKLAAQLRSAGTAPDSSRSRPSGPASGRRIDAGVEMTSRQRRDADVVEWDYSPPSHVAPTTHVEGVVAS